MGDWRLPLNLTLIAGRSDYGKSTFAFRYLYNCPGVACRFIFDDQGRDGRRLEEWGHGIAPCFTGHDMELSLARRWVVFNPSRMFPADPGYKRAFAFFCKWVYDKAKLGPGRKLVLVNEVWRYQDRGDMPPHFATLCQAGREEGIEPVLCTQMPHETAASITLQATELVVFRCGESETPDQLHRDPALAKIASMGVDPRTVQALQKGQFVGLDKLSRQRLCGKLW